MLIVQCFVNELGFLLLQHITPIRMDRFPAVGNGSLRPVISGATTSDVKAVFVFHAYWFEELYEKPAHVNTCFV